MTLLEFQRRMAEDVSRPLTAEFAMQAIGPGGSSVAEIAAGYVKANDRLSSFERLEIYNRQYWFRLIAAVSEDFPALHEFIGPRRFDELILKYLRENPSISFSLRDLGAKLPSWLEDHPELTGARHDLAIDVARLEWAYIEAFDSATRPPIDETNLAELQPTSVLALQPHLQLLALRYPADEVVLAAHEKHPDADIVSNAVMGRKTFRRVRLPRLRRSPTYLVVHRHKDVVYYRRIDREEFLLLSAIQEGEPLATVVEKAFYQSGLLPSVRAEKIHQYFAHAAELGWLIAAPA
jgi:hypothetical protein